MTLMLIAWHGPAAPPALVTALRTARYEPVRPGNARATAAVHCTSSGRRLPSPGPSAGDWIWLCQADLTEAQRLEAIARGAYDAISLRDPRAAEDLVARLGELAVPLPVPPRESTLALKSAAARHVVAQVARVASVAPAA